MAAPIRRPSESDPDRLGDVVARALRGGRSAGELYDAFLQVLREAFSEDTRLALYTEDGDQLRLQAQHGHDTVVHTLALDAHLVDPAGSVAFSLGDRRALIDVGRPFEGAERQELTAAVAALRAAIETLGSRARERARPRVCRARSCASRRRTTATACSS